MKEMLGDYFFKLYNGLPAPLCEGLLSVFCLGAVVILVFLGRKRGMRKVAGLLFIEYVFLIYYSTVFTRYYTEIRGHNFHPFWSYLAIKEGSCELIAENIMNVVVFFPIGLLLGCVCRRMTWWKVFLSGLCLSTSIEVMQLIFNKGFSEVDDIIHNTLGCLMGYGLYSLVRLVYERISKRNVVVL